MISLTAEAHPPSGRQGDRRENILSGLSRGLPGTDPTLCSEISRFAYSSTIATIRTIDPSPFVHRQGKAAMVTRFPVTLSMSPPTFSKPTIPLPRRIWWQGSQ